MNFFFSSRRWHTRFLSVLCARICVSATDKEVNDTIHGKEAVISTDDSKVKVVVVPTDEEIVIARDTMELVK